MDSTGLDRTNGPNASRRDMKRNFQRVIETQVSWWCRQCCCRCYWSVVILATNQLNIDGNKTQHKYNVPPRQNDRVLGDTSRRQPTTSFTTFLLRRLGRYRSTATCGPLMCISTATISRRAQWHFDQNESQNAAWFVTFWSELEMCSLHAHQFRFCYYTLLRLRACIMDCAVLSVSLSVSSPVFSVPNNHSGTKNAIFTVRKIVERLNKGGSTANICAIDLSKAFDKINHCALYTRCSAIAETALQGAL